MAWAITKPSHVRSTQVNCFFNLIIQVITTELSEIISGMVAIE